MKKNLFGNLGSIFSSNIDIVGFPNSRYYGVC